MFLSLLFTVVLSFAQQNYRFLNPTNQGVLEIDKPDTYSRVISIGDIGGQYIQLYNLLASTQLISSDGYWKGGKSLLIFTGNLIGKGPQNITVIDFVMNLSRQAELAGGRIIVILGSEELKLLAKPNEYKNASLEKELIEKRMRLEYLVNPIFPRAQFLRSLTLTVKVGTWLFMHEGYYPGVIWDQYKTTSNMLLFRGYYDHELLVGPQGIYSFNDWWKDKEKRSVLKQRLFANNIFGVVFGGREETFGAPNEIGISDEQRFIKVNASNSNVTRLLVFMSPQQMESLAPAKVVSVAPGLIIKPLN